jgi:hypothetical protein
LLPASGPALRFRNFHSAFWLDKGEIVGTVYTSIKERKSDRGNTMIASETVLFAIRGALKLGMQARAAYVDATRRRALVLPILDFQFTSDVTAATSFFLANLPEEPEQLVALVHKAQRAQPFTPEEEVQLLEYHSLHKFTPRDTDKGHAIAADGSVFEAGSLNALVAIRQWERGGDPNPSTLNGRARYRLGPGPRHQGLPGGIGHG